MTRMFCFTCAAVASAEVAPDLVWSADAGWWAHTGRCCRCQKEKAVMEYTLVATKKAVKEIAKGGGA